MQSVRNVYVAEAVTSNWRGSRRQSMQQPAPRAGTILREYDAWRTEHEAPSRHAYGQATIRTAPAFQDTSAANSLAASLGLRRSNRSSHGWRTPGRRRALARRSPSKRLALLGLPVVEPPPLPASPSDAISLAPRRECGANDDAPDRPS